MANQKCPNCNRLFEGGDLVKAIIVTRFVPLKSKVTYALERPSDCLDVFHVSCQYPQTGEPEGD